MPATGLINTVAKQLVSDDSQYIGSNGIYLRADPSNASAVYYGFSNAVTIPLANNNTTQDGTAGMPLAPGAERFVSRAQFIRAGFATVSPANIWVISQANTRMFWEVC